ncbi:MAG: GntR family transcriptional regulator [Planctomycetes bacterium]|nr:GntR family transcriptional regulator [Planctomycetota bacterium]
MRIDTTSAEPFYQQIKDSLRGQIAAGIIRAGACIPDERSMAQSLNVSRKTTRRALLELTEEGLLRRVRGKGTFVRDSLNRQSPSQSSTIVVVSAGNPFIPGSPYYAKILNGVYESARELGFTLAFEPVSEPYDQFVAGLRARHSVRGVIVIWAVAETLMLQLQRLDVPVILLDCHDQGDKAAFDLVAHDGEPGVYAAVKHLVDLGHTDIAFLRPEKLTSIMQRRLDGYVRACVDAELGVRPELIIPVRFYAEAVHATVTTMLREKTEPPTALVCVDDDLALGAMAAVSDFGWKVPRDMSVVGFGHHGQFTSPRLSTVRVPTQHMGSMAVRMLEMRLAHPTSQIQRMVMPVEWMAYGSCAAPRPAVAQSLGRTGR